MRIPKYRLHRASGRAVMQCRKLYGTDLPQYLPGKYGSRESRAAYAKELGRLALDKPPEPQIVQVVSALMIAFMEHATAQYRNGQSSSQEFHAFKTVAKIVSNSFGEIETKNFGAIELEAVRDVMVEKGWARRHINRQIVRARQMFRWGVKQKLVPAETILVLQIVRGLAAGRTKARETSPIRPADWDDVAAVLSCMPPVIATMVRLHYLSGMRSGELVTMRAELIDRTGDVWHYRPARHKNLWRGKESVICLGPQACRLVAPYLSIGNYLFRPAVAVAERGRRRKKLNDRYDTHSYHQAIKHAFVKLANSLTKKKERPRKGEPFRKWLADRGVTYWHPHQLRHSRGTVTRDKYGIEGSQSQLGHSSVRATEIYAEKSLTLARKIARETG